ERHLGEIAEGVVFLVAETLAGVHLAQGLQSGQAEADVGQVVLRQTHLVAVAGEHTWSSARTGRCRESIPRQRVRRGPPRVALCGGTGPPRATPPPPPPRRALTTGARPRCPCRPPQAWMWP